MPSVSSYPWLQESMDTSATEALPRISSRTLPFVYLINARDYTHGVFIVRAMTNEVLEGLRKEVLRCFEAAALGTGCKLKIKQKMKYKGIHPSIPITSDNRLEYKRTAVRTI
jgi:hypothetical protein